MVKKKDKYGYYHIDKKKFDEFVRLDRKYHRTGDTDILPARRNAFSEAFKTIPHSYANAFEDALSGITCWLGENKYYNNNARIYSLLSFFGMVVDE